MELCRACVRIGYGKAAGTMNWCENGFRESLLWGSLEARERCEAEGVASVHI